MLRRRWSRPWTPCPRRWAHRQRGPWIPATSVRPTSPLWNSAALNHTSRWDAKRITTIGRSIALHRLRLHRMTRAHWSQWPPNSERRSARPSIACAHAPSNRCLASSKKCWAFANSPYAAGRPPPESGVWSVWPAISNDCMCCSPTERRVSLFEARKTSDGTDPADPNVPPLSERAADSCPMSRSDPCRVFLSDKLLGWPCSGSLQLVEETGGYCWSSSFHAIRLLLLRWILAIFGPSTQAGARYDFRHLGVDQQYPAVTLASRHHRGA